MATEIFKTSIATIGVGKAKAEFVEVIFGKSGIVDADTNIQGEHMTMPFPTGSSLDEPFGLLLVSQSLLVEAVNPSLDCEGGAVAYCTDASVVTGEVPFSDVSYVVDNVISLGSTLTLFGNATGARMPIIKTEQYAANSMQRVFVGKELNLDIIHYIRNDSTANTIKVACKWVFKKVKMTKNAYLEKLAIRAYS
jgi:hypothetical protein